MRVRPTRPGSPRSAQQPAHQGDATPRRGQAPAAGTTSGKTSGKATPASSRAAKPRTGQTRTTGGRRRAAASTSRIPKGRAASRPGGPSGPGRAAPTRNRIEPAAIRGTWFTAFSWRVAVLAGVVVLAAAVVLPSLRAYFRQQEELAELRADAAEAQQEVEDLEAEVARWDDPAFVVAQARERLTYVFPGETPYRVIDPETVEGAAEGSPAAAEEDDVDEDGTWYTRLAESVEVAGSAKVGEGAGESADEPEPAASSAGD